VSCGSLLLESDIGGGLAEPPVIGFGDAKAELFYTLLYVDTDAMTGYWPDEMQPGEHAPVRHWVKGNIPGTSLIFSNATNAGEDLSAFVGPSPPSGSHRYVQWLFEQPSKLSFEAFPDAIQKWDYEAFLQKYGLGRPVASNWHVTQSAPARDAQGDTILRSSSEASSDSGMQVKCTPDPLVVAYDIKYYSGNVSCGSLLLESDIGGGLNVAPHVSWAGAVDEEFYTLIYLDPDADMAGSWPNVTEPGGHAPVRHWVVGNIAGKDMRSGDLSMGNTVSTFKGPSPPSGSHRYAQLLFPQGGKRIQFEILDDDQRVNWDYEGFVERHQLPYLVVSNWHVTQHMEPRMATQDGVVAV
jgi:phosphatidylethanolamine-binding protein (PEBP) family uncharacterized protein